MRAWVIAVYTSAPFGSVNSLPSAMTNLAYNLVLVAGG